MATTAPPKLTPDQQFEVKAAGLLRMRVEMARRYAERGDILNWGKICFPDKFDLAFCWEMHQYFVDIREDPFTNTEAPRNHSKTTIKCFLIPLFIALNTPKRFKFFLNVQATDIKALAINRAIKHELENNPVLRELYGDQVGPRWTDQELILKNGVIFKAISAGQSIRGINVGSIRPDYIIVDDLYNREDINNPESTEKKNDWFWGDLFPARAKHRRCSIHVQGTAINKYDLLEELKGKKRWKSKTFAAIKVFPSEGIAAVVLWPELNSYESLMLDKDDMGSVIFYRELQNERRDDATSIIKMEWIQEYDPAKLQFDGFFQYQRTVVGGDPSIGKKNENDNTSYVLYLVAKYADARNDIYYIEDIWDEHLSLNARVLLLQKIQDGRPPNRKITKAYIEAVSGFKDFADEAQRRTSVPIEAVDQVADKITVLENKSHFFENKRVFINQNIPKQMKDRFIYQMITNHPKNDDIRDAALLPLVQGVRDAMSYAD